jgi:uncharacterized spore protein YtfJ
MDAGNLLSKASENLSVRRAFGAAYEQDGTVIIPVALVAGGGGGGRSRTPATPRDATAQDDTAQDDTAQDDTAQDDTAQDDTRSGRTDAGGGMGGLVMPAGVYVVRGGEVRWVPAVDVTLIALVSLGAVRVLAGVLRRSGRRARRRAGGRAASRK